MSDFHNMMIYAVSDGQTKVEFAQKDGRVGCRTKRKGKTFGSGEGQTPYIALQIALRNEPDEGPGSKRKKRSAREFTG